MDKVHSGAGPESRYCYVVLSLWPQFWMIMSDAIGRLIVKETFGFLDPSCVTRLCWRWRLSQC